MGAREGVVHEGGGVVGKDFPEEVGLDPGLKDQGVSAGRVRGRGRVGNRGSRSASLLPWLRKLAVVCCIRNGGHPPEALLLSEVPGPSGFSLLPRKSSLQETRGAPPGR